MAVRDPQTPVPAVPRVATADVEVFEREITLHGHRIAYLESGARGAPVVVLLHGIGSSSSTWERVLPVLGRSMHVVAPDLMGHGRSDKPRGDYSLGAFASSLRDLLLSLGLDRATVIGHSLGGGIAMQFAYQYPERCQRLVLVSSGGLGRDVSIALRAATLPGSALVLSALGSQRAMGAGRLVNALLRRVSRVSAAEVVEVARVLGSFRDAETRTAFVSTARAVMDVTGQRVDATDRFYLTADVPVLVVVGARDALIPAPHSVQAHGRMPGSRLEVFDQAGHFPHCDEPRRFARLVLQFVATTKPAALDSEALRRRLRRDPASSDPSPSVG
ncbi:MAG: alpha/beta fold hydrolase [Candidatus Dormibacteria bacterium]